MDAYKVSLLSYAKELPPTKRQAFPLFSLPRELRDRIYFFALSPSEERRLLLWSSSHERPRSFSLTPALLRTNKQVHDEAESYLYENSKAIYQVDFSPSHGATFRETLNPDLASHTGPLFRKDPRRAQVKAGFGAQDAEHRDGSLAQDTSNTRANHLEYGIITGRNLLRMRHIQIHFSMSSLWHRGNSWDYGRENYKSKTLMYMLDLLAQRKACHGHTHVVTLMLKSESHHEPFGGWRERLPRNKKMLGLVQQIKDQGTLLRIVCAGESKLREEGDEDWQSGNGSYIVRRDEKEVRFGEKLTAKDLFGHDYSEDHKPDCDYCTWS